MEEGFSWEDLSEEQRELVLQYYKRDRLLGLIVKVLVFMIIVSSISIVIYLR